MRVFAALLTTSLALLVGCISTSTTTMTTRNDDADAQIRAAAPRFYEAFNRGDWTTVRSFFADDAVLLAPHADIARGPAAIQQAFSSFGAMRPQLSFRPDRIEQSGDLAYEYGTYEMRLTPPDGSTVNDRGKYLTVWRRMPDGQWKIVVDTFNTSLPGPGM